MPLGRFGAIAIAVLLAVVAMGCSNAPEPAPDWTSPEDEVVRVLTAYLQLDTTNPPGNERRAADFFARLFERHGIRSQIYESAPGRASIVARIAGDGSKPAIVLLHHMDVVPAEARFWKVPPFAGELRGDELWGRGALDDKAMGASSAVALIELARAKAPLASDVIFLGVADEEDGGALGAGFMVEQHFDLFEDAGVVLNEGGYIATDNAGAVLFWGIEVQQKVPLWLRITADAACPAAPSAVMRSQSGTFCCTSMPQKRT